MQALLDFSERPWVALVVGTVLALVGIYISFRLRSKKSLDYVVFNYVVLQPAHEGWDEDLRILYKDFPVTSLSTATIGVWNSGNVTIDGSDVAGAKYLTISSSGPGDILFATVLSVSRPEIAARVEYIGSKEVSLAFEFMDASDGILMNIVHGSSYGCLSLSGTVKGIPQGLSDWRVRNDSRLGRLLYGKKASLYRIIFASLSLIVYGSLRVADLIPRNGAVESAIYLSLLIVMFADSWIWVLPSIIDTIRLRSIPSIIRSNPGLRYALRSENSVK